MTLEQLKAMSDTELNELSAVKVMGWEEQSYETFGYMLQYEWVDSDDKTRECHTWIPTTDMNDARQLQTMFLKGQDGHVTVSYINNLTLVVGVDVGEVNTYGDFAKLIHASPRAITIASILAKEE